MKDTINIHGKEYETVASRVKRFRIENPGMAIETELIYHDAEKVIIKAMIKENGIIEATGHAEEVRKASKINQTSAIENCETSAIGRALACFGYLGTEFASADEVAGAIKQQSSPPEAKPKSKSEIFASLVKKIKTSNFDDNTMAQLQERYASVQTQEQGAALEAEVDKLLNIQKKFVDDPVDTKGLF